MCRDERQALTGQMEMEKFLIEQMTNNLSMIKGGATKDLALKLIIVKYFVLIFRHNFSRHTNFHQEAFPFIGIRKS